MTIARTRRRVLAIFPCRLGFSYAILEGTTRLVDWDMAQLGVDSEEEFCMRVESLLRRYEPQLVVLEDCSNTRRGEKAQKRIEAGLSLAKFLDFQTRLVSPDETKRALGLTVNSGKHDIAERIVERFPELARKMPKRRIWQRDPRMSLFEAIGLCASAI